MDGFVENKQTKPAHSSTRLLAPPQGEFVAGLSKYFLNEQSLNLGREILAGSQCALFKEEARVFCVN